MATRRTIQQTSDTAGAAENNIVSPTYAQTAGDTIVVVLKWESVAGAASLADTAGNTYTSRGKASDAGNLEFIELFDCINCTGHASNIVTATLPNNSTYRNIVVMPYLPAGTITFTASPTPVGGGGPSTSPATAAFTAGQLAVCGVAEFAGTTSTAATGWTEQADVAGNGSHAFDRIDNPGGTITGSCTIATSAAWSIVAASYADSGVGGGGASGGLVGGKLMRGLIGGSLKG